MKYEFELVSACGSDWDYLSKLRDFLLNLPNINKNITVTKKEDPYREYHLYIRFTSFDDLDFLIHSIPEEIYDNSYGWKPDELVIDFLNKQIWLRDYYLE